MKAAAMQTNSLIMKFVYIVLTKTCGLSALSARRESQNDNNVTTISIRLPMMTTVWSTPHFSSRLLAATKNAFVKIITRANGRSGVKLLWFIFVVFTCVSYQLVKNSD